MKGSKKLSNTVLSITSIVAGASVFNSKSAWSDLGKVLEHDSNYLQLPQLNSSFYSLENNEQLNEEEILPPLRRPWNLETPAGPTAFVLNKNKWELFGSLNRIHQLLGTWSPLFGVRYGITDFLTMDTGLVSNAPLIGLRWKVLNSRSWNLAIRPWSSIGAIAGSQEGSTPRGVELSSSLLLKDYKRLHFSFEYGVSRDSSGYTGVYYSNTSIGNYNATRFVGSYETRFDETYGMTFSVSPEWNTAQREHSSSDWDFYTGKLTRSVGHSSDSSFSLLFSAGFHSWTEKMGYSLGISFGPSWSEYASTYTHFSSITVAGSLSGGIHFRL